MGSRLLVLGLVFACVRLSDARLLGRTGPTYRRLEQQKPAALEAGPAAEPEREHSSQSAQQTSIQSAQQTSIQSAQLTSSLQPEQRPAATPFSWRFPEDPVDPVNKPPAGFRLPQPAVTDRVAVRCGENKVQVEVKQDLQGLGRLLDPQDITLGGCSATEIDDLSHVLVFESELHGCGSRLVMTESAFIYAFTLVYNPKVLGRSPIIRSQRAVVGVECHYLRKLGVSRLHHPAWKSSDDAEQQQPSFSLQLMDDDWLSERTSSKYSLGDTINMQASVLQSVQTPLRLLVERCVATKSPESTAEPRQAFIKNSGCLGGRHSGSRFRPQSHPEKLQFQVKAYSLRPLRTLYITCRLKAVPASSPVTVEHKACYFDVGWKEASGKHQFCPCCEVTCGMRKIRDVDEETKDEQWEAEIILGPIDLE